MSRIVRTPAVVLAAVLAAGTTGCGGGSEDAPVSAAASATATSSATPTAAPSPTSTARTPGLPGSSATPAAPATPRAPGTDVPTLGIPTGFPTAEVPLLPGLVTGKTGGEGEDGRVGWVLELSATGTQDSCFEQAAAKLVAAGFTKQGEITAADTRQAQFTSAEYAVIVSVRADGDELCQASYEVGQVAG